MAKEIKNELQKMESQFKLALPQSIPTEKFLRVLMTTVQMYPDLLVADRRSLYASCLKCAADGLLPDGREAAIVTYNTKEGKIAQYMPMVFGIIKKIRNTGELGNIVLEIVHEKDEFNFYVDEQGQKLLHKPNVFADRGAPIGAYAIIKTQTNYSYIEVMSKNEIMAVRAASKAKNGPWEGNFKLEMWKKTVLRRLSKRVPMNSDIQDLIRSDDDMYEFEPVKEKGKKIDEEFNNTIEVSQSDIAKEETQKSDFEKFEENK